jgi:phage shock protein PspC (stress-responsive transcriptional regulator)
MKLSERQEAMVESFLRRQADAASHLPPERRVRAVELLRKRIDRALEAHPAASLQDGEVKLVLRNVVDGLRKKSDGKSEDAADGHVTPEPAKQPPREPVEDEGDPRDAVCSPERVWLGVCLAWSERLGFDPLVLRTIFVAGGLLTGPFAVLAYLGLYVPARRSARKPPTIHWNRVALGVLRAGVWVLALYGLALGYMMFGHFLYEEVVGRPPVLERWDWLRPRQNYFLFWAAAALLPFGALTEMPVVRDWAHTLKKLLLTGVALYALLLSYGLARFTTGLLLLFVDEFAG